MIPLAIPHLGGNEAEYLRQCVETNWVSSVGPFVDRFEGLVAEAAGVPWATATASGTSALHLALTAVGVGPDDLVVTPSFSFIATANAVRHCGADPWLFDVGADSWTLDAAQVATALGRDVVLRDGRPTHRPSGRRVAAVLPVHTLGVSADMDALVEVARRFQLPVVADAAAALGATASGRPVGALGATLSVFSFNGNKTVTTGGGGAVVGVEEDLVARVRHLATTARVGADYVHDAVGFNCRMTNLAAAVGCAQLERLDEHVQAKRRVARRYQEALAGLPGVQPFPCPADVESACWLSGVILSGPAASAIEGLRSRSIGVRSFWRPIHLQEPYAEVPREPLTVTESIWRRVLTLPSSVGLSEADQQTVIEAVRTVL